MSRYLDDLAKKISDKAYELGGVTRGSVQPVVTVTFHSDLGEWQAWVPVKEPHLPGYAAAALKPTIQDTLQTLAREIGAL